MQSILSRVQSLEKDNYMAQRHLRKTLDTLDKSDKIRMRKQQDMNEKYQWLSDKNDHLLKTRMRNQIEAEQRRKNIFDQT